MDISHLRQKFIDEANDLLAGLDGDLIALEKNPVSKQHIDQVFRTMHTIKGASGMYSFEKIMEITHELETLYDLVREQKLSVTKSLINLTFSTADHIRNLLSDFDFINDNNIKNHEIIKETIVSFNKNSGISAPNDLNKKNQSTGQENKLETWQILFYPDESLIFRGVNLILIIGDLYSIGKCEIHSHIESESITYWSIFLVTDKGKEAIEEVLLFINDNCKISKVADFDIFDNQLFLERENMIDEREKAYEQKSTETNNSDVPELQILLSGTDEDGNKKAGFLPSNRINVEATKLDTLMYLVTELVTSKSELLLAIQNKSDIKVYEAAEKIDKLSKLFSENALSIRLVSLHEMLVKFQRLIRDLSNQLGKKVNFTIKGDETELDKNIVDIIAEPIMHLIRNCIDHGLELPSVRTEKGKQETGTVFFNAYSSGNNVFLQIGDDGKGIDQDYILQKAIDRGFVQPGVQLNEKEILDLIFLPGFSTANNLTEISGRGVGMDIVKRKIQEIRGEILIESFFGKGTTFTIKLQQTISIIDTLLITSDRSVFAIPIEDVEACDLEEHENIFSHQSNLLDYNSNLIPFLYLREKFEARSKSPEKEKLIIINKQGKKYAIVADEIIGQHQAVIKPLTKTFEHVNFLSGASILGDGSIALLLDTDKLKNLLVA